jgi:hypothetical protein
MKQKKITQKLKPWLLAFFALMISGVVSSQTIVKYDLTDNYNSTVTFPASINTGTFSTDATVEPFSGGFAAASGWDNAALSNWSSTVLSTVGYYNVSVAFYVKAEATSGPKNFELQYRTNAVGVWQNAGTYTQSPTSTQKTFTLPAGANNSATLYIRWHQTNLTSIANGAINSATKSFINGVNVTAQALLYPQVQSSDIRIVARTSTSITISWTKGGATHPQLLMMNTVNDFTPLPVNDQTFTPLVGTYTSGRQVIFNTTNGATPATFTVSVPSATATYWFRVFDYEYNSGMERYGISENAAAVDYLPSNPKLCYLEQITLNPATFKLITANISATIAPKRGTISERGVLYSLKQNFINTDAESMVLGSDYLNQDGTFNFEDLLYDPDYNYLRGKTVYYKAYATNESGTIFTDEMSFNNSPIYETAGTWETAANWNVKEVPGSTGHATHASVDDSPRISANCILTNSNSVTNLDIDNTKSLTINASQSLNVVSTLTNSSDQTGIVIKAASGQPNGSLKWTTGTPTGTVEMYTKSHIDGLGKKYWQYFGIPVSSFSATTINNTGAIVRKYDETNNHPTNVGLWNVQANGATLNPVSGYEIVQPSEGIVTFTGTLNHSDYNNQALAYTLPANWSGQHILGNPYTAAINIASLTITNGENNVYLYNTGSLAEWAAKSSSNTNGTGAGQYTVANGNYAGVLGVNEQIPSMQGFLVKVNAGGGTISIPYSSTKPNTLAQRVRGIAAAEIVGTRIDVVGSKYSDQMWIFSEPTSTRSFDNGLDGRKLLGSSLTPQLFSMEEDGYYQINAVNSMNDSYLGFQAGSETNLKLTFTHQNLEAKYSAAYLVDLQENKSVDITASGSEYEFTAVSTPTPTKRFKIVTIENGATGLNTTPSQIKIFNTQGAVYVQNSSAIEGSFVLYNMSGSAIKTVKVAANGLTTIPLNMGAGSFVAKVQTDLEKITQRLIIR